MKKAAKSIKTKKALKKAVSVKIEKNKKIKNAPKQLKIVVKKASKKIIKNKLVKSKAEKPIKKPIAKKNNSEEAVKNVKISIKKIALPLKNELSKKVVKSIKKSDKFEPDKKKNEKIFNVKIEEAISKKPLVLINADTKKEAKIVTVNKLKVKPSKSKGGRKPKNKDDDEPEILHDELVEQLIRSTKKLRSQPKKPRILQTFTNPRASLSVVLPDNYNKKNSLNPKKEPKGKFELEYVVRTSAGILYEFLTTPSGLSEWFADNVNIQDGIFTFFWDGSEQKAKLLSFKEDKHIRFQWFDKPEGTYFEFRIERDDLTGDISLLIIDFAEEVTEMKTSKLLWDSQINKLLHVLGSY